MSSGNKKIIVSTIDKNTARSFANAILNKYSKEPLLIMEIQTELNKEANGKWVRLEDYEKLLKERL